MATRKLFRWGKNLQALRNRSQYICVIISFKKNVTIRNKQVLIGGKIVPFY